MHIVFHRHKKSFLIIEMKLHHCIRTLEKNNITLYQRFPNWAPQELVKLDAFTAFLTKTAM